MPIATRRLFRPSLRVFMVAILIICAGLGWIVQRAKTQRLAVEAIRRLGGSVRYDLETDKESYFDGRPGRPALLNRFLGPEYFDDVTYVGFPSSPDADPAMPYVRQLRRLREISLYGTSLTDAGLAQLRGSDHIRQISLGETKVTGEGLVALVDLPRLEIITTLPRGPLGEAGYRNLGGLTNLVELNLNCRVDDIAHLHHLRGLTRLRKLHFSLPDSLSFPGSLSRLDPKVGNIGFEQILKFTELQELSLSFLPVDDARLARLASLPHLRKLTLRFARVTTTGVDAFRARRPDVKFVNEP